ncbi:hypothetical protein BDQ17DRAFT_33380 [Cyathus striatus]|nr:hypothetical protein BDQ17DRAFT_33380 [Cyathus striatus]
MEDSIAPPNYSQADLATATSTTEPQILIVPSVDGVNFQKGFLGAEGERAAIEGELQVKAAPPFQWSKVTISLRTFEIAYEHEVELSFRELELYSGTSHTNLPSSFPFALPLTPDTPQSLKTPHSSLSHILTAVLYPLTPDAPVISKSLKVHTRRYSPHGYLPEISPETYVLEEPTRVEVQVPGTKFIAGNPIPLYVTIPPPKRELVVDDGLRLRNVQAEIVRVIGVRRDQRQHGGSDSDSRANDYESVHQDFGRLSIDAVAPFTMLSSPSGSGSGSSYMSVVARSGASCRFHSSQPIQLRFIMHQPTQQNTSNSGLESSPNVDAGRSDSDEESPMISQFTIFHSVTFQIKIYISFVDTTTRKERISTLTIPIVMVPPPAPLPEISSSIDEAYSKKHDRPPTRTVRQEDSEPAAPNYPGEAGPSMISPGAPPPFEERDAPPPFFPTAEASSSHLPSFLESEQEVILPDLSLDDMHESLPRSQVIPEDMQRLMTPPPSLEMANMDTNLTSLTDIGAEDALEALNLVLEQDPPPSIDSDFRVPETIQGPSAASPPRHSSPPPRHPSYHTSESRSPIDTSVQEGASHGHAPPPYLHPENHQDEHVMRPPPYAD